jgi:glycosyltransferase involved in cell wall biosynthesis
MKICFVVDGRSAIAKSWIRYFVESGHEVHMISTFPCDPNDPPVASLHVVPLDFSARARSASVGGGGGLTTHGNPMISKLRGGVVWKSLAALRDKLNPTAVLFKRNEVRAIIEKINPDLVHAMRIPFEGILAAYALEGSSYPLLTSVWGNDFTLFANDSPTIAAMTRKAMARTDALHPDCERDLHLAAEYGFDKHKPSAVLPGNGGVRTEVFHPGPVDARLRERFGIPQGAPVVINPRGVKPYIRTNEFFQAIPLVLKERPDVIFMGSMMEGNGVAEGWVQRLDIGKSMRCLPFVTHDDMAQLFRLATVTVSPADHDGTPNTLLEAMSCGTFPVAGNIESVREWIVDRENGLLYDQTDSKALAATLLRALSDEGLRARALGPNQSLVKARASYSSVMPKAVEFYSEIAEWVKGGHLAASR